MSEAEWLKRANAILRPMVQDSAYTVALFSGGEPDSKQAVELGFMILLDKPIILAVERGVQVPEHLVRVADEIIEVALNNPDVASRAIKAAMQRMGFDG